MGILGGFKAVTKSGSTSGSVNAVKAEVAKKLVDYKENIQKVTAMLQDQTRTRFVVICIAEFLSISETKRLLQELKKNQIRASHVIVNQLVVENALSKEELSRLEALAEVGDLKIDPTLLEKTIHACRLTTARKEIQQKYLNELIAFESSNDILEGLCQVPLLSMEPTGNDAILYFSKLLMKDVNTKIASSTEPIVPSIGETVRVMQLEKSPQFNVSEGKVITKIDEVTGRVGVSILTENNKKKKLSLLPKNLSIVRTLPSPKKSIESDSATKESKVETESDIRKDHVDPGSDNSIMTKKVMKVIEEDPEIRDLVQTNPRLKDAIDDCASNPSML